MRLHPPQEENSSDANAQCHQAQWKSNDEQTEAFRPLRDGASRFQKLPPGNSHPRNKPDKALYFPRAQCQNNRERRRDVKFNYKREGKSRKANSSRKEEGSEPRRGRIDTGRVPAEEEDVPCGQTCTPEDAAPLCALARAKAACAEEGEECTASNLGPIEREDDAQENTPNEDAAADQVLDVSPAEPEGKRGPNSKDEMKSSSNEERAGEEKEGPRLHSAGSLLEDDKPSLVHQVEAVQQELQTSTPASKTAEATGTGPRAPCNLQLEDNAAFNHDQSPTSSTVDLTSPAESRHTLKYEEGENMLGDQEETCRESDNLLHAGDFSAEDQVGVEVKTEGTGTPSPDARNPHGDSADLLKELSACLKETSISIEQPQSDYSTYLSGEVHMGELEFGHIIEIYDFLPQLKTEDIQEAFGSFRDKGFRIKWVDSTHALGLFSSPDSASEALSISHSQLKSRPLSQATKQSKLKVARCSEFLQPVKERAQTNTVIAKRLVIRALGLQGSERKGQPNPKPKSLGETKVQLQKTKTDDSTDDTLDSAGDPSTE
ncbi:R3H and coiled-coil domain-containing protein 1-like [Heptranchias perlo]|uniref:R3H and coiled-coil domain-containing protein 1-like n=1 Tax=Heptranchias perlo TaxID=212740 RepID=UPI00355A126E